MLYLTANGGITLEMKHCDSRSAASHINQSAGISASLFPDNRLWSGGPSLLWGRGVRIISEPGSTRIKLVSE